MKILYDHQMFSVQTYGGVTKYFSELMKNIPREHEYILSLIFSDNEYLKEGNGLYKRHINPMSDKQFRGKLFLKEKIYYFLNKQYSKHFISLGNYDLFHPTFYDDYFFHSLKRPYIITVHDLIIFKFKDTFFRKETLRPQMEKVIINANRIISVSQNTKRDLVDIFNISPEKIDVIYHGFNKPDIKAKMNNYGRYILFVGRRNDYKNFKMLARAASSLLNKESDLKLICVGNPFCRAERDELRRLKILEQTTALSVDEKALNNLYSNAQLFVYPSLYEGFGMPILEAFANNCPVCLSNTSCFPEIAGDAGVYFDPNNHESILGAVKKVLYDDSFKNQMINAGKKRLADFSWEKTAEETIVSYKKTLCV